MPPKDRGAEGVQENPVELTDQDIADQAFLNRDDVDDPGSDGSDPDTDPTSGPQDLPDDDGGRKEQEEDPRLSFMNRIAKTRRDRENGLLNDQNGDSDDHDGDLDDRDDDPGRPSDENPDTEPPKRKIKLKVDKREFEMDEDEVIAAAQKQLASDRRGNRDENILEQLVSRLDALSKGQPQSQQQPEQNSTTEPDAMATTPAEGDQITDEIREMVEQIQTGDADEGARALSEIMKRFTKTPTTDDIETTVNQVLSQSEKRHRATAFVNEFARDFPEIVSNPEANDLVANKVMRSLADEFYKIGVKPEDLAPFRYNPSEMYRLHSHYVDLGYGDQLSEIPDLLKAAGTAVKPLFPSSGQQDNPIDQGNFAEDRGRRKRALSSQPTNSGHSSSRRPQKPARQSRGSVIREMARSRAPG